MGLTVDQLPALARTELDENSGSESNQSWLSDSDYVTINRSPPFDLNIQMQP